MLKSIRLAVPALQILLFSLSTTAGLHSAVAQSLADQKQMQINSAAPLSTALAEVFRGTIVKSDTQLLELNEIQELYRLRNYKPIWIEGTAANRMVNDFRAYTALLDNHGLNPKNYLTTSIEEVLKEISTRPSLPALLRTELLLTQSLVRSVYHLAAGRFDPDQIDHDIKFKRKSFTAQDYARLAEALNSASLDGEQLIAKFVSQNPMYLNLAAALKELKNIKRENRSYLKLPFPNVALAPGVSSPAVVKLRQALTDRGYTVALGSEAYDSELEQMLLAFQRENAMEESSSISARSDVWKSLNFTLDQRIRQVEANLEKIRWLPAQLESRHIFVNLAFSELNLNENNTSVLQMKTVNGRPQWRSPSMRDVLTSVILNPTWTATDSIVSQIKLPEIIKDVTYLEKNRIRLIDRRTGEEIDATTLDWQNEGREIVRRALFVQDPGPKNALGIVKFMLSINRDDIYMHDTDEHALFSKNMRQRSSGCIRLEKPLELANYLLNGTEYTPEKIDSLIAKGTPDEVYSRNMRVSLARDRQIPVYLLYLTASTSATGHLRFAPDYYSQDTRVIQAAMQSLSNKETY